VGLFDAGGRREGEGGALAVVKAELVLDWVFLFTDD
jgi:hypothetical protein